MAVSALVREFHSAPISVNGESPRKIEVLHRLEDLVAIEPRALEFILQMAADSNEYDLARAEAFAIVSAIPLHHDARAAVAKTLMGVLQLEQGELVLQHASKAAASFADFPDLVSQAARILVDPEADLSARHNLLLVLERAGYSSSATSTLKLAAADPQVGPAARRILQSWPDA